MQIVLMLFHWDLLYPNSDLEPRQHRREMLWLAFSSLSYTCLLFWRPHLPDSSGKLHRDLSTTSS